MTYLFNVLANRLLLKTEVYDNTALVTTRCNPVFIHLLTQNNFSMLRL